MRSYRQYCGLARSLDVVGDRWVLLIVRELLEGPRRFNELLDGLPGVATNLLTQRLRDLEADEVVERTEGGGYRLTEWGQGLRPVVYALGEWARPLMVRPAGRDEFRSHWLVHPINLMFGGVDRRRPRLTIEVNAGQEPMTIESRAGRVTAVRGRPERADLVLTGPPDAIAGLLGGGLDAAGAAARGVTVEGDAKRLLELRPGVQSSGGRSS